MNSEDQFQELLANLAPRLNRALARENAVPLMGLLLSADGDIEPIVWLSEEGASLSDEVNKLQAALIEKAGENASVAACLSYPDYANEAIVVLLENSDNACAQCTIPVVSDQTLQLDLAGMKVEDGYVFVFGQGGPA